MRLRWCHTGLYQDTNEQIAYTIVREHLLLIALRRRWLHTKGIMSKNINIKHPFCIRSSNGRQQAEKQGEKEEETNSCIVERAHFMQMQIEVNRVNVAALIVLSIAGVRMVGRFSRTRARCLHYFAATTTAPTGDTRATCTRTRTNATIINCK